MKKIKLSKLLVFLLLTSCATVQEKALPLQERTFVKIDKIDGTAKSNFNGAVTFLSKSMKNSNHAIKVKDFNTGKIVAKINFTCKDYYDGPMGLVDRDIDFTVDVSFKPKKIKIELVAEGFSLNLGTYGIKEYPITDKSPTIKCQEVLYREILAGLRKESNKDNW